MVAEETKIDNGDMTQAKKEKEIWKVVDSLENKGAYCDDAMQYMADQGINKLMGYSFYTNYICRRRLFTEPYKLNILYDFTKDYTESTIGSEASEPKAVP